MNPSDLSLESPMGVILETLPGARRALFSRYHLGGCSSCAFSQEETLRELCARSEIPAEEALAHLLASHEHDADMWVAPREAKRLLKDQPPARLIDLRTREEHEAVVIPSSELFTQELQRQLFAGDPQAVILLYDHEGKNALDQVAWFRGHGLKNTYALQGGIDAWSREVDPTLLRYRIELE